MSLDPNVKDYIDPAVIRTNLAIIDDAVAEILKEDAITDTFGRTLGSTLINVLTDLDDALSKVKRVLDRIEAVEVSEDV